MRFYFDMEGEDHTQFIFECDASTRNEAIDTCVELYPEAKIIGIQSQQEWQETQAHRERRLAWEIDNDMDYDDYLDRSEYA